MVRVKALYLEPHIAIDGALVADLVQMLRGCAAWQRTPKLAIDRNEPVQLQALIQAAVRG